MNRLEEIKKEIIKPDYYDSVMVVDYFWCSDNFNWRLDIKLFHSKKLTLYNILLFFKMLGGIKLIDWDEDTNYDFDTFVTTSFILELDKKKYKKYKENIKEFIYDVLLIKNSKSPLSL